MLTSGCHFCRSGRQGSCRVRSLIPHNKFVPRAFPLGKLFPPLPFSKAKVLRTRSLLSCSKLNFRLSNFFVRRRPLSQSKRSRLLAIMVQKSKFSGKKKPWMLGVGTLPISATYIVPCGDVCEQRNIVGKQITEIVRRSVTFRT